jgi:hypothetical protein
MAKASLESARDELYGLDPEDFMLRRGELTKAARDAGDGATAKQIGALRKPTRSAYAVNALVRADAKAADRIEELGDRLRDAQESLDGAAMRELSTERNKLVDELTRAALRASGAKAAAAGLRDEVANTLSAAIADPEVRERVREGALVRAESWSGFGAASSPNLTVVRDKATEPKAAKSKAAKPTAEDRARERHAERVDEARGRVAEARDELETAKAAVVGEKRAVKQAEEQLKDARRRLDDAELDVRRAQARLEKARTRADHLNR